jgi:UDP-N-acetylmuramyl pentapeptide phosphotransferase/UDP-N-acetylglucosamine-1-phosphate transferase
MTLSGLLVVFVIPVYASMIISIFLIITVINAYNLIDGIDGLASGIGIVISVIYMVIYYYLEINFYFYLSLCVTSILLAFLRFNLSSSKKIFMGDTGSLIIGFIISLFTIKLLTLNNSIIESDYPFIIENLPLLVIVILIIPLFDTARVFAIRILNKRSPFSADRNHMHHILVDLGLSHVKASLILIIFNLILVAFFTYLSFQSKQTYLIFFFFLIVVLGLFVFHRLDYSFSSLRKKVTYRKKRERFKKKILDGKKKKAK